LKKITLSPSPIGAAGSSPAGTIRVGAMNSSVMPPS